MASTRLTAERANATQALHLLVNERDPLPRFTGLNVDEAGQQVDYGRSWLVGDRVTLTLDT